MSHCPPDEDVVERLDRAVDPDVADVERRAVEDLEARAAPERPDVLRLDEVVTVDLPGLERLQARRVVGDRAEDQTREARPAAPVVVVPLELELVADPPGVELERPGPCSHTTGDAVLAERLVDAVGGETTLVGPVLPHRRRALDRERRERHRREERPVRSLQVDDGDVRAPRAAVLVQRVLGALRLEAAEDVVVVVGRRRRLLRALEVVPTVEVRTHGRRVERRAVVELDVAAERERPAPPAVALLPAGREHRSELRRARPETDERLRDLVDDAERLAVGDERRIQHDRVCRGAEHERRRRLARAVGRARRDGCDQKREHGRSDSCSENSSHSFPSFLHAHRERTAGAYYRPRCKLRRKRAPIVGALSSVSVCRRAGYAARPARSRRASRRLSA